MSPKRNQNNPELSRQNIPESGADRLDFKQELILWTVLRARDSDDQSFKQESRHMLVDNIRSGIITRNFLKPIYDSLDLGDNFADRKLSPTIIRDELIPLDQGLLIEEQTDTAKEKKTSSKDKQEIESPVIRPEEMPVLIKLNETIVPSDDRPRIVPGSGNFEKASSIPRFEILARLLLDNKFEKIPGNQKLLPNDISVIIGRNRSDMVRSKSYQLVLIQKLAKMVFICNEEGNNTFVINGLVEGVDVKDDAQKLAPIYGLRKSQLRELEDTGLVGEVRWSNRKKWEGQMVEALQRDSVFAGTIERWQELVSQIEEKESDLEYAPAGWLTTSELSIKTGKNWITIAKMAENFRQDHPEWFRKYLNKKDRASEYFAPMLIAEIEKITVAFEKAPDGWLTNSSLSKKTGYHKVTLTKAADKYRTAHPEYFKIYLDGISKPREHYSPELIGLIEQKFTDRELAPENWQLPVSSAKKLSFGMSAITEIADGYRERHPGWFKTYAVEAGPLTGQPHEYFAPELISVIEEELKKIEEPPSGWRNTGELAKEHKLAYKTVKKILDKYRPEHPEWFKKCRCSNGITEYFAPEAAEIVRQKVTAEKPTAGWKTKSMLAHSLSANTKTISLISEKYRNEHPQWFKTFVNISDKESEYFSPELVARIKKDIAAREKVPEGWMSNNALAESLGKSFYTVEKIAKAYQEQNPQWFKSLYDNWTYYSPELIEKIREKVSEVEPAPAGWLHNKGLSQLIGKSKATIAKEADSFRETHPEWFKEYYAARGAKLEHYAPELIKLVIEKFSGLEPAPEGWANNYDLAKKLSVDFYTTARIADAYRQSQPQWFGIFLSIKRKRTEFFSPELVQIISEKITSTERAPEGWISIYGMADISERWYGTVIKMADRYREQHPEWFKEYYNERGQRQIYYAPELANILKEELKNRKYIISKDKKILPE